MPADKSAWNSFSELAEYNFQQLRRILEGAASTPNTGDTGDAVQQVGAFYASALNTDRLEVLGFRPIQDELKRIDEIVAVPDLINYLSRSHQSGGNALFSAFIEADAKKSSEYALYLWQGGLSLPDRDYYLQKGFAAQRTAFERHLTRMFGLLGDPPELSAAHAATVLQLETRLARANRSRTALRDDVKNYHKFTVDELAAKYPALRWKEYLAGRQLRGIRDLVVGQPEVLHALHRAMAEVPLGDWRTYLRWHVLHGAAPFLHQAVRDEDFDFFQRTLAGRKEPEPRWRHAAIVIDQLLGESLGQLYVREHYPAAARARMNELVERLKEVFRDRLQRLEWMNAATRQRALAKFDRFRTKIGHPDKFRDYSSVRIEREDYLGNIRRAEAFETLRQVRRIGQSVDREEWRMSAPTVNAYFNPMMNEIVFPAGILQPPFFDATLDDAVNYGGIGVVIGHEITHGYDDQGRRYDADGNLNDWWTKADAREFDRRAKKVVHEYNEFVPLPDTHVNGQLTLGENIADLGGVALAYDALQRLLKAKPSRRKKIDGFTPEQRFFLAYSQLWRDNCREPERRRRLTIDPHSPGEFRAIGPLSNFEPFHEAFGVEKGDPMWLPLPKRVTIW